MFIFIFIFLSSKNNKKKQALHETIRASSLSIISVKFFFKPVYPTMVLKSFNFGKLQLLEDVLASQILTLDIFTHMLQLPPPHYLYRPSCHNSPSGSIITPGKYDIFKQNIYYIPW